MKEFHINNRKKLLESIGDGSMILSFSGKAPIVPGTPTIPSMWTRTFTTSPAWPDPI
ncbi:hypothetical protein J0B03_08165 [Alkalibacter rhizosphaerae]|uniref:Uncharacterized protein n=1 Tax=Alkalibacter rhizosphaerae TaxID=2815577 RepID=A0A975AGV8_9FIRM|nr:hypothetical protein [Alkalibacter rhizosphaerae]QSX07792.1 hypothetical protein J0B03_08165 [Alkalibacter rhizosphaerae]